MAAAVSASSILAICGVISLALGIGAALGRTASTYVKGRQARDVAAEQRRQNEAMFHQAFVGTPANEYGPARPGMIDQVRVLTNDVAKLTREVGDLAGELYKLKVEFHDHVSATNGSHP